MFLTMALCTYEQQRGYSAICNTLSAKQWVDKYHYLKLNTINIYVSAVQNIDVNLTTQDEG